MKTSCDRPPLRVFLKYTALQLPGLAMFGCIIILIRHWFAIPAVLLWGLLILWVLKDVLLFPLLWRSYDPRSHSDRFDMIGRRGLALTLINPRGYVQIQGERWQAVSDADQEPIQPDQRILVTAIDGLTLTVRPDPDGE